MIAIFKREVKNYLKWPLFWVGVLLVIYGVFNATSPYLTTHYLEQGEKIVNDYPDTVDSADVYEGYIPANPEKHREIWIGQIKQKLMAEFEMSDLDAQSVINNLADMELEEAFVYLEEEYDWYGARYLYENSTYYKGTPEEINAYLDEKMENKTFSFYYSRKFADFAGLFMFFFATIMLAVLFLQDTKKHTYELLHTKPMSAGKYVLGKVSAGFTVCLIALAILNIVFWALCLIYTKDSGFEVRLWDFVVSTVLCNGVQREHNKKLNNGLPILHKVPPKRDYGRYFCIMAEKGGTSHGGLTEKLSLFFHAKKQEVNAYGR